jgi:hypothetical protein
VTLAQGIGWSAVVAWYMWLIFGPAVAGVLKRVTVTEHCGLNAVRDMTLHFLHHANRLLADLCI